MKVIDFIPKQVGGEKYFEGVIKIKLPSYKERLELIKSLKLGVDSSGDVNSHSERFDSAIELLTIVESHVISVDLVQLSDESVINSLDDLGYSQEGSQVINDLGNMLVGGVKLGKV